MNKPYCPHSLYAATLADGIALAQQLAALFQQTEYTDMAAQLRAGPPPAPALIAAQCFTAIATANHHWKD